MSNKRKFSRSDLICPQCYNVTTIQRSSGREILHKKRLYCYVCKEEVNHIEVKDIDKFFKNLEFLKKRTPKEEEQYVFVKKAIRNRHHDC